MSPTRHRLALVFITVVAAAAAAASCSSDDTDGSSTTFDPTTIAGSSSMSVPATSEPAITAPVVSASATSEPADAVSVPTASSTAVSNTVITAPSTIVAIDVGDDELIGLAANDTTVYAVSYQTGTVSAIDPATNAVSGSKELPGAVSAMFSDGSLWVVAYGPSGPLFRVDPASLGSGGEARTGELCCDLTSGGGLIWALDPGGKVYGIEPATLDTTRNFPVDLDRNAHSNVVYGGEYLWVSSDTTGLQRVDPITGDVQTFDVGGGVPFFARDGLLWGATPDDIWVVDVTSGDVVTTIGIARSIEVISLEADETTVWVGIRHPGYRGAVLRIDRASGEVLEEFSDVSIPAHIVLAFGSAWVTDSGSSSVFRITPAA